MLIHVASKARFSPAQVLLRAPHQSQSSPRHVQQCRQQRREDPCLGYRETLIIYIYIQTLSKKWNILEKFIRFHNSRKNELNKLWIQGPQRFSSIYLFWGLFVGFLFFFKHILGFQLKKLMKIVIQKIECIYFSVGFRSGEQAGQPGAVMAQNHHILVLLLPAGS